MGEHYQRPGWFTTNVFNRLVAALTGMGLSVYGSRVLEVRGRKSGEWRQTPVNVLRYGDHEYLVAPRGHTQWVKNLRASGQGRLRVGRTAQPFAAVELTDDEKAPLLRAYLKKWKFEVGTFFGGVGPDSSDAELLRISPDHPVFRLSKGRTPRRPMPLAVGMDRRGRRPARWRPQPLTASLVDRRPHCEFAGPPTG